MRTIRAEHVTVTAAKIGGTIRSILDLINLCAGRQRISAGTSRGTLMETSGLHERAKDDDDDMAETKATSGAKEATATVSVRSAVHVTA